MRCASATGKPSSLKPAAPSRASSAISVSSCPRCPLVIAARNPTGTTRLARGTLLQRSAGPAPRPRPGPCSASRGCGRSRPRPRRASRTRGPPRPRVPGVRRWTCGSTNPGSTSWPSASTTSAPSGAVERAGRADLGDDAVADQQVVGAVQACPRVEQACAADQQRRRLAGAGRTGARGESAGRSRRLLHRRGGGRPPARRSSPESSSYRIAMRTTRPAATWSTISACGESITSADSSTPRLTGPGCIRNWRGLQAPAVDLVAGDVLPQRRHEGISLAHALVLHPQRIDDVGRRHIVEVVAHLAAEGLDVARDQGRADRRR